MRRVFAFVLYLAMIAVGLPLAAHAVLYGGRGIGIAGETFLTVFGCYLLWADFISGRGA